MTAYTAQDLGYDGAQAPWVHSKKDKHLQGLKEGQGDVRCM